MTRFRLTFDYPGSTLFLAPGAAFARPFEADMSGLSFNVEPGGRIAVTSVEPGSPGDEAGIREGDRVHTVDGQELTAGGLAALKKRLRGEGEAVRLELERGAERVDASFTTKRLI
jgi:carboxyl-terminal processing protease